MTYEDILHMQHILPISKIHLMLHEFNDLPNRLANI